MSKVLVTGGAGFIGSHIVEALVGLGHQVRVFDNLSTGHASNLKSFDGKVELIRGDVADFAAISQAIDGCELVFHQAALASVPLSVENPAATNRACVEGTLNVLQAARKAKVRRVMYAASSSCYGDQPTMSKRESDVLQTLSPYAVAKLAGEFYCQAFYHTFGLETVCLRYFNVFGPRQDPNSPYSAVIPIFITKMLRGDAPVIFGDGEQSRDFSYVANVVHANMLASTREGVAGRVFNVANGKSTTLNQLIRRINELLKLDVKAKYEPPRLGDVRDSLADITAARRDLGYDPVVGFDEGLARSIDYYKAVAQKR